MSMERSTTLIANPNPEFDVPVVRTLCGSAGADPWGHEIFVSVDVDTDDGRTVALVNVAGIGDGDDGIVELETADGARKLAAALLVAADVMDATPRK